MIAALSAADQRRRRTDRVETATPRSSHFASLLPSNITITRSSPLLQAKPASQPLPLKKGARTPLTIEPCLVLGFPADFAAAPNDHDGPQPRPGVTVLQPPD